MLRVAVLSSFLRIWLSCAKIEVASKNFKIFEFENFLEN